MPAPGVLLDLALTLDPGQPESRQRQTAVLASRLGYAEVWLPVGAVGAVGEAGAVGAVGKAGAAGEVGGVGGPDSRRLTGLAAAAAGARLGVLLPGGEEAVAWLLRLTPDAAADVLVELPAGNADLVRAVGGAEAWRARVRLPAFDPAAAGTVIAAATRTQTAAAVAAAVVDRAAAGLRPDQHPVVAALPVSIGRTLNEAEARASRDPRFAGPHHPRERGLFGTHEQAQMQVLDLAAAGADALRVTVPDEVDVADLLAQVRSLVVGATPVLHARRG
jgi:hypothetical protein